MFVMHGDRGTDISLKALDLTPPLPVTMDILSRWAAEPTRHIFLPASAFVPNARGYPVLTKATQSFLRDILKVCLPLRSSILSGLTLFSFAQPSFSPTLQARFTPAAVKAPTPSTSATLHEQVQHYKRWRPKAPSTIGQEATMIICKLRCNLSWTTSMA